MIVHNPGEIHSRNTSANNTPPMMDHRSGLNSSNATIQLPNPKPILDDFNAQDFNSIRFSAYRTACKLRYIQNKASLRLLDLVNMMETMRSGLDSQDLQAEIDVGRLREIFTKMYNQLNQRLPVKSRVDVDLSCDWLLYWLLTAYDTVGLGSLRIFALKIALAVLCQGSLADKLTYIFSLLCNSQGTAVPHLLDAFLLDLLQLPRACGEGPSFSYSETTYADCFGTSRSLTLDVFLDDLVGSEPGPPPVVWLILVHSVNDAQEVYHNIHCNSCHRNGFYGFRYKCQQCPNYQSCQECFWKGRVHGRHTLEHEMKETSSTYKSPAKQIGDTLRRSFRRNKSATTNRLIPTSLQQPYSLSATASPEPTKRFPDQRQPGPSGVLPMYSNGHFPTGRSPDYTGYGTLGRQQRRPSGFDANQSQDDEHILIARYAAMLQSHQSGKPFHMSSRSNLPQQNHVSHKAVSYPQQQQQQPPPPPVYMQQTQEMPVVQPDMTQQAQNTQDGANKEQIIAELEARNREIMREITKMRRDQMTNSQLLHSAVSIPSSNLLGELKALRLRKHELEQHMNTLQDSRKQLMDQLEIWMKRLKMSQSSRSTPTGSPRPLTHSLSNRKYSTLPRMGNRPSPTPLADRSYGGSQNWQADLLSAADSVTNAMTSLVRELNSDSLMDIWVPKEFAENSFHQEAQVYALDMKHESEDDRDLAAAMSLHGNGMGTTGRKSVKLYTVPTVYPSDDERLNGGYGS